MPALRLVRDDDCDPPLCGRCDGDGCRDCSGTGHERPNPKDDPGPDWTPGDDDNDGAALRGCM